MLSFYCSISRVISIANGRERLSPAFSRYLLNCSSFLIGYLRNLKIWIRDTILLRTSADAPKNQNETAKQPRPRGIPASNISTGRGANRILIITRLTIIGIMIKSGWAIPAIKYRHQENPCRLAAYKGVAIASDIQKGRNKAIAAPVTLA